MNRDAHSFANIYVLDEMQKKMKIPFWSPEIGPNGSWMPLYVNVKSHGVYGSLFPTILQCKDELKRSLSWISELKVEPELFYIKIPMDGEPMPTIPVPEGDYPLSNDWVVNDRTALYINIPLPEAGYPLQCDMASHKYLDAYNPDYKKDEVKDDKTSPSDTSIKDWVLAKSANKKMTMADVEGLDIDSIYKMGFAAGMQKAANDQESTLGSRGSAEASRGSADA